MVQIEIYSDLEKPPMCIILYKAHRKFFQITAEIVLDRRDMRLSSIISICTIVVNQSTILCLLLAMQLATDIARAGHIYIV